MERYASFFSPVGVLSAVVSILIVAALPVYAQTAAADTSVRKTSTSSRITINVIRDTAGRGVDSLSSGRNAAGADTLTAAQDSALRRKDTMAVKKDSLEILTSNASYNTIPGFRVQVLTTQTLNKAIKVKAVADSLLPKYNIYIVYDAPYYKVRVGNFRARYEANQAVMYIANHGFPNAWLVPDNIFRNPPRRQN